MRASWICHLLIAAIAPQLFGADDISRKRPREHSTILTQRRRAAEEDIQEYYEYMERFNVDNNNTIVGGSETSAYPWFVHFASKVCAGTLISPNRVLTSATCLQRTGVPSLVRVGATTSRNGILAAVGCAKTHPDYTYDTTTISADVAVLKLTAPVPGVDPVTLNKDLTYPSTIGQSLTAMGMGYQSDTGDLADHLQDLEMRFLAIRECQALYQSTSVIQHGFHLCTQAKRKGLCVGDGGGPLVDPESLRQVGVASFTYGQCGTTNIPDVFSSVAFYYAWIVSQIDDNSCDGLQTPIPTTAQPTVSPAPSVSLNPSLSLTPSTTPTQSNNPSASALPSTAPTHSLSPSTMPTSTPTSQPDLDLYVIAVQVFNTVVDSVGALLEIKGGILQRKRDWFDNKKNNGDTND